MVAKNIRLQVHNLNYSSFVDVAVYMGRNLPDQPRNYVSTVKYNAPHPLYNLGAHKPNSASKIRDDAVRIVALYGFVSIHGTLTPKHKCNHNAREKDMMLLQSREGIRTSTPNLLMRK